MTDQTSTPEQMRALAIGGAGQLWAMAHYPNDYELGLLNWADMGGSEPSEERVEYEMAFEPIAAALRAAADQLEATPTREQVLDAITYGNPYSTCDFEEEIADRIMAILTAGTAPQDSPTV